MRARFEESPERGAGMPLGYVIVDSGTVRGPDGRDHDVLDAIAALPWTAQLCPLMRHEYSVWKKGPEWAWNVVSAMLLAANRDSFRAYFRGYQSANRYWDAPDGLRYWRGRFEIDRGRPDGAGLRRVDEGGRVIKDWDGPPYAPSGIGLYEQDVNQRWWPTETALAGGYLPCASCEQTNRRTTIVATPSDPHRVPSLIAAARDDSLRRLGRGLDRDELERVLRRYPDSDQPVSRTHQPRRQPSEDTVMEGPSDEISGVIEWLLDLREADTAGRHGIPRAIHPEGHRVDRGRTGGDRHGHGHRTRSTSRRRRSVWLIDSSRWRRSTTLPPAPAAL